MLVEKVIITVILSLSWFDIIIAGQHDCGDQQHPNRSLSMDEASAYLKVLKSMQYHFGMNFVGDNKIYLVDV